MRARVLRIVSLAACAAILLNSLLSAAAPVAYAQEPVIDVPGGEIPAEPDALPVGASAGPTVSVGDAGDDGAVQPASPDQANVGFTFKVNTLVDEWDTDPN